MNLLVFFCGFTMTMAAEDGGAADCESDVGVVHQFSIGGKVRCFNLMTPANAQKPMRVVVFFHGKGGKAQSFCKDGNDLVTASNTMGFALLCGDAYIDWQFPATYEGAQPGIYGVGSNNYKPCSSQDTEQVDYMGKVFEILHADKSTYDESKIYFQGFSQGSMMTTWAGTCFANQIAGASQAGSGLKVGGAAVTESWCQQSKSARCEVGSTDGNNIPGGACPSGSNCQFFPIKPTSLTGKNGQPLKFCLFGGCSDYLIGSVLSQAQQLTNEGLPNDFFLYNAQHEAPDQTKHGLNWMAKVAACHAWAGFDTNPQPDLWLDSCASDIQGTNAGKYCEPLTVTSASGKNCATGSAGGGGGGGGGGGSPPSCTAERTSNCCGDGTCGGPETTANCANDCSQTDGGGGNVSGNVSVTKPVTKPPEGVASSANLIRALSAAQMLVTFAWTTRI